MKRRSATQSTPRKRYTNDPFEGVEELQETAPSDEEIARPEREEDDDDDDSADEFQGAADDDEEEFADEEPMSGMEDDLLDDDDANDDDLSTPKRKAARRNSRSKFTTADFTPTISRPRTQRPKASPSAVRTYIRGIEDGIPQKLAKAKRKLLLYGPDERDTGPVEQAKLKWEFDPTLPSAKVDRDGRGGMQRSFFLNDGDWARERLRWDDWWEGPDGEEAFMTRQSTWDLEEDEALIYMPQAPEDGIRVLLGPFQNQQEFEIPTGGSLGLSIPWNDTTQAGLQPVNSRTRSGYLLNLGAKVQCLDWAPNQKGKGQYLAVAVAGERFAPDFTTSAAFTPSLPEESAVQIWRFQSTEYGLFDQHVAPHLETVLCNDWGAAKVLKWSPVPDGVSNGDAVGLLAGIWADGFVRVLRVAQRSSSGQDTIFQRIEEAAFASRPPNTVCTCLTWISSVRLAAGCANGCIAVWDLDTPIDAEAATNARPAIYSAVAPTYILSIVSCAPSRPNLLLTSSMSGYIAMSDLSRAAQSLASPAATVLSNRTRVGAPLIVWHDYAQIGLHVDEGYVLRGSSIRRIFSTTALAKYRSSAICLATSACHPFVLVGCAGGEVVASNPMRRMLEGKAGIWQQVWFSHEWKREARDDDVEEDSADEEEGGLSRMLEGFKAERAMLNSIDRNAANTQEGTLFATIYEEKSAVTALAWNPNLAVGGWAAAGMGNGLLRVQDLGLR
ncbi:hypothetical protein BDY17DRAFT_320339 [Neohortaea acidophila]|uniref:WD40-repeat-containing domain protein n=1 Tax=Neohortaea acidophila TaxID=245834 RepID=A0A6A6Q750_9PEZI|nr:uncharacterized protein BDY17DRAFT_320339 [Neohortaea acidophila]KAF2487824.1 hypothetical protein BDY17DRAFT_320339 [Neohortaea acidophila]